MSTLTLCLVLQQINNSPASFNTIIIALPYIRRCLYYCHIKSIILPCMNRVESTLALHTCTVFDKHLIDIAKYSIMMVQFPCATSMPMLSFNLFTHSCCHVIIVCIMQLCMLLSFSRWYIIDCTSGCHQSHHFSYSYYS